jgi:hypothetical protein
MQAPLLSCILAVRDDWAGAPHQGIGVLPSASSRTAEDASLALDDSSTRPLGNAVQLRCDGFCQALVAAKVETRPGTGRPGSGSRTQRS